MVMMETDESVRVSYSTDGVTWGFKIKVSHCWDLDEHNPHQWCFPKLTQHRAEVDTEDPWEDLIPAVRLVDGLDTRIKWIQPVDVPKVEKLHYRVQHTRYIQNGGVEILHEVIGIVSKESAKTAFDNKVSRIGICFERGVLKEIYTEILRAAKK